MRSKIVYVVLTVGLSDRLASRSNLVANICLGSIDGDFASGLFTLKTVGNIKYIVPG
jgi:hypothetical protein